MKTNHVNVTKEFNDGMTNFRIKGLPVITGNQPGNEVIQTLDPGKFEINDNQPLEINLVDRNAEAEALDPRQSITKGENTFKFYIKLESHLDYDFNVSMNANGWKISQIYPPLSREAVMARILPKRLNILPVRLLLLPFELLVKVFSIAAEFVILPFEVLFYKSSSMRRTNKLVFVPLLPKRLNTMFIRLLIMPLETFSQVFIRVWQVGKTIYDYLQNDGSPTGNTNITVGS